MVILKAGNQLLLLKRLKNPNKGKVTPVGGKLEPFENPSQAAIRETMEETGIQIDTLRYAGLLVESAPNKYNWNCIVYIAEIDYCPAPPCDEGVLNWYAISDLPRLELPPTDLPVFDYALRGKPFFFNADFDADLKLLEMWEEIEGKAIDVADFIVRERHSET